MTPMAALAQALPDLTLEQRQQIEAFNPGIFERLEELGKERFMRQMLRQNRVNPRIYRYIDAAVELNDEGDTETAVRLLKKLNPKRLNDHERAVLYRVLAYLLYGVNEYEEAIGYFKLVLDQQILQPDADNKIRFSIAQLYAALQNWELVLEWIQTWLLWTPAPEGLALYLAGVASYQLENMDNARMVLEVAVNLEPEPAESWLQLLTAVYVRQEDYEMAAPVLEEMVGRFGKKQYWVQLSLIYGARDEFRNSLAVQQLAYQQGLLTEDSELRRLARSYLYHNLPYPAARLLEQGIAAEGVGKIEADAMAYELLANSWLAAREYDKSYEPLKLAADLSDDGDLYIRLGQVHMQREEWGDAARRFEQAIAKGDLTKPGGAQLLLGISYYNTEDTKKALRSFRKAKKHDESEKQAKRWLQHLTTEANTG
jgi:tetratricopeptide (TPR) repeat protein